MSDRPLSSVNPATEQILARFDPTTPDQIEAALARVAHAAARWRSTPIEARDEHLHRDRKSVV